VTPQQALSFVREAGVVLASGKGPVPNLADAVAGEPIRGSWWAHSKGRSIFATLRLVEEHSDILVCRLVNGKITFVHRRLWPALVRASRQFPVERLGQIRQEHTKAGHHVNHVVGFPDWVPPLVAEQANRLEEDDALEALGDWACGAKI
jgi:hypothetical protein